MSPEIFSLLFESLGETLYMVAVSMICASILGIPLGILL